MQTLESLRRRIDSAKDLQTVVKTMKAIAAVSIRQYDRALESLRQYNRTVEDGFRILIRERPRIWQTMEQQPTNRMGAIIFGAAQGMAGQFDEEITSFAARELSSHVAADKNPRILCVGFKTEGLMQDHGFAVEGVVQHPGSVKGIGNAVYNILTRTESWHAERPDIEIILYFNRKKSSSSFEADSVAMFPLDPIWLENLSDREWSSACLPTHHGSWDNMFASLIRQHFFISLYRAFAESLASENASRLASMQAAESNIEERLEDLETEYNHRRQDSITSELLDIVSGYEALQQSSGEESRDAD